MDTPPPAPAPKKGLSGLAIAGLGCLALIVLLVVVGGGLTVWGLRKAKDLGVDFQKNPEMAGALLVLKMQPDLEVVKADEAAREITVKNKKTGEVVTLSLDDVKNGKISMKNSKGEEVSFDPKAAKDGKIVVKGANGEVSTFGGADAGTKPPAWVPAYPAAGADGNGMRAEKDGNLSGTFHFETPDAFAKVKAYYEAQLKAAGFEVETTDAATGEESSTVIKGTKEASHQSISAMINSDKGKTGVLLQYEGPK